MLCTWFRSMEWHMCWTNTNVYINCISCNMNHVYYIIYVYIYIYTCPVSECGFQRQGWDVTASCLQLSKSARLHWCVMKNGRNMFGQTVRWRRGLIMIHDTEHDSQFTTVVPITSILTNNDHRRDVHGVVMIVMPRERRVRTNGASRNSKEWDSYQKMIHVHGA